MPTRAPLLGLVFTTALVAAAAAQAPAPSPADLAGEWNYTLTTPAGETGGLLTLTAAGDSLSGTMTDAAGQAMPLLGVEHTGTRLSFDVVDPENGRRRARLAFDGDFFTGRIAEPGRGSHAIQGVRSGTDTPRLAGPLSASSKLRALFANEEARAVLEKHLPGLTSNPQLQQAMDMSLREIAPYAPDYFTEKVLQAIDDDLAKL